MTLEPVVEGVSSALLPEPLQRTCRHTWRRQRYQFRRDAPDPLCVQCAILCRSVLRRALTVALIVGTILTIINQGDILLAGRLSPLVVAKIGLTYTVPYCVSTWSALQANRQS